MTTVLLLLLVLGIMVLVHEFGHFAVAKLCGIRVEVFSIGFGKRLIGFRRGETDYRISLLPLGGYVKMTGEQPGEATSDDPAEFSNHPRWQRVLVALAGPFANFVLAIFLMTMVFMYHHEVDMYLSGAAVNDYTMTDSAAARAGIQAGDRIVRFDTVDDPDWESIAVRSLLNMKRTVSFSFLHDGRRVDTKILVAGTDADAATGDISGLLQHIGVVPRAQNMPITVVAVEDHTPAQKAGLKPDDQISAINGVAVHSVPSLLAYMQDQAGKPAKLIVLRGGQSMELPVTPAQMTNPDGTHYYGLGFHPSPPPVHVDKLPFGQALRESWTANLKSATMIKDALKGMFERRVSAKSLSGPIGIGQQVGMAARDSIWTLFRLMAVISINLGIFNLLPIPILDGGMILFLLIESAMRRDLDQTIKERVYQVAFVCLIAFAAFVIFNDITKLGVFSRLKS